MCFPFALRFFEFARRRHALWLSLDQHISNGSSDWVSCNLPLTCDFTKVADCIFDHFDKDADNKNVNVTFSGIFKYS